MKPDEQIKIAEETVKFLQDYVELKKTGKRIKIASVNDEVDVIVNYILDRVIDNLKNL